MILLTITVLGSFIYQTSQASSQSILVEEVAAVVNNEVISLSEIKQHFALCRILGDSESIEMDFQKQRQKYIERKLIYNQAVKYRIIEIDRGQAQKRIKRFLNLWDSPQERERWMDDFNLTMDDVERLIQRELLIEKFVERRVNLLVHVSNLEVKEYYAAHKARYDGMPKAEAEGVIKESLYLEKLETRYRKWIFDLRKKADIELID